MPGWQLRSGGFPRPPIQAWATDSKLTTQILLAEPRIANEIIYVAGDTNSCGRLAQVVEEVTGQDFEKAK